MSPADRQARIERIMPEVVIAFLAELDIPEEAARPYAEGALRPVIAETAAVMAVTRPDIDALSDRELIEQLSHAFVANFVAGEAPAS